MLFYLAWIAITHLGARGTESTGDFAFYLKLKELAR